MLKKDKDWKENICNNYYRIGYEVERDGIL